MTSSTSIMAANRPLSTGTPSARRASRNSSYSPSAFSGDAASVKDGTHSVRGVPVQCELGDHQKRAADLANGPVHPPFVIRKDTEADQLPRHPRQFRIAITGAERDEREQARTYAPDRLLLHPNGRSGYSLDDDPHPLSSPAFEQGATPVPPLRVRPDSAPGNTRVDPASRPAPYLSHRVSIHSGVDNQRLFGGPRETVSRSVFPLFLNTLPHSLFSSFPKNLFCAPRFLTPPVLISLNRESSMIISDSPRAQAPSVFGVIRAGRSGSREEAGGRRFLDVLSPRHSEERQGLREDSTRLQTDLTALASASWSAALAFQDPTGLVPSSPNPRCGFQSRTFRFDPFLHAERPVDLCQ